jgi:acetylornithine deacetylase/succinyl-diaminopimelate desuccinylase-like protein
LRSLFLLAGLAAGVLASAALAAPPKIDPALHDQALEILKRGIAFKTSEGAGNTVAYAEYLKGVLTAAGYKPDEITIEPMFGTALMIARYPGTDPKKKPLVISGHMDVVAADPKDWTRDPFTPVVENGWIYGRGAVDDKYDVSVVIAELARLRREGWKPGRDVVLALSGDEETTMRTTAVLAKRLAGAELVLNTDGGGGELKAGKPTPYGVQGAEKTYADFTVTFTDPGGHSSRPTPTNAIYRLAKALDRIAAYRFPTLSNEITRAALAAEGAQTPGPLGEAMKAFAADPTNAKAIETLSADPNVNPRLRTTCVATMLSGGHAPNALPQKASATVNCRIFPGTPSESVRQTLAKVIDDPTAEVKRLDDGSIDSPASPLRPDVLAAVGKAVHARYPGLAIVPWQDAGASDSMYFRAQGIPSYGVSGLFMEQGQSFIHGLNEKAPVDGLDGDLAHWDSILRDLAK